METFEIVILVLYSFNCVSLGLLLGFGWNQRLNIRVEAAYMNLMKSIVEDKTLEELKKAI